MIESVRLRNFRAFEDVKASDLGRLNIIVGDNRQGKTAFLEAMYLASGNSPTNHLKMDRWRGYMSEVINSGQVASGMLWRDLFRNFSMELPVIIELFGKPSRRLDISYKARAAGVVGEGVHSVSPVTWKWKSKAGEFPCVPTFTENGLVFPDVPPAEFPGAMFSPTVSINAREAADKFSELDIRGDSGLVLDILRSQFPEIEGLSVLSESGNPMLYVTIEGTRQKMPLPLHSSGINRWVGMMLTASVLDAGLLFIDEIESGIYYSRLPKLWQSMNEFSLKTGSQVFATLHSGEALKAITAVSESHESDLRLIRVRKDEAGRSQLEVFGGKTLAAAIAEFVEVR